jgi:hypothetical protein
MALCGVGNGLFSMRRIGRWIADHSATSNQRHENRLVDCRFVNGHWRCTSHYRHGETNPTYGAHDLWLLSQHPNRIVSVSHFTWERSAPLVLKMHRAEVESPEEPRQDRRFSLLCVICAHSSWFFASAAVVLCVGSEIYNGMGRAGPDPYGFLRRYYLLAFACVIAGIAFGFVPIFGGRLGRRLGAFGVLFNLLLLAYFCWICARPTLW